MVSLPHCWVISQKGLHFTVIFLDKALIEEDIMALGSMRNLINGGLIFLNCHKYTAHSINS